MADSAFESATPIDSGIFSTGAQKVGSATPYRDVRCVSASSDPGVSDDSADGFHPGARWFNLATGIEWICYDAASGAAIWAPRVGGSLPRTPLVAGRYYSPTGGGSSTTVANNTIYWFPFHVPTKTIISALGFAIGTGSVGNAQVAIYPTRSDFLRPTGAAPLAATGNISTNVSGTGTSAAPTGGDLTLYPGPLYWIGCNTSVNSLSVQAGFSNMSALSVMGATGRASQADIGTADNGIRGITSLQTFASGWPDLSTPPTFTELTAAGSPFWTLFFRVKP